MSNPESDEAAILEEVEKLRKENDAMAYANYMGQVTVLRADILLKMESLGISPANLGWMYFNLGEDEEGSLLSAPSDLLVMCTLSKGEQEDGKVFERPRIRLFKSELFHTPLGSEYLTTDAIVDQEGDAQYLVDSVWLPQTKPDEFLPTTIAEVRSVEATVNSKANVPFFAVDSNGKLVMAGEYSGFTRPFYISMKLWGNYKAEALPFGHYSVLTDSSDAVTIARSLFDSVKFLRPKHFGEIGQDE